MTILVVDDEPEYRLVLKNVLLSEGYQGDRRGERGGQVTRS